MGICTLETHIPKVLGHQEEFIKGRVLELDWDEVATLRGRRMDRIGAAAATLRLHRRSEC